MTPETGTALDDLIDAVQKAAYLVRHRTPTDAFVSASQFLENVCRTYTNR